ncbi:MAG TPA: TonB-dependent receptor [Longimicrobiaceae bacterium]|nr:TonB-dependent receptor [Longimicrobiaceae bacterium]
MNRIRRLLVLVTLGLPAAAGSLAAQSGTLRGQVRDETDRPLAGAQVQVEGTRLGAVTSADGGYLIVRVPAGTRTMVASMVGHRPARASVEVTAGVQERDFVLAADPLGLDELVVSGSFNPATKLESSTAITTLTPKVIEDRMPRGTADLLRSVPGVQVINTYGEQGADVTVRGLPVTANSSFRYVGLQEDGLPVFEAQGLLFAFPDAMARLDATVERVEVVRGGSAAVFGSGTPGGIVNLISKTGGPTLGGTLASSAGSQGMARLDGDVGGPLGGAWRFNVGGYWRYDDGARPTGFPVNRGGQLRANVTRTTSWGHVRFFGKYLDERDVWYMGIPFQNYLRPEAIPGGPDLASGTTFSEQTLSLTVPDAFHPGSTVTRDLNGATTRYGALGVDVLRGLGAGWSLTLRAKALRVTNLTNIMVDVADPMPIGAFGPPSPKQVRYVGTGEVVDDPAQVSGLNGNGLMTVHGLAFIDQPVTNGIANVEIARTLASHSLTGGIYLSDYTTRLRLVQEGVFLDVRDHPQLIQVGIAGPGGAFAGLTPGDGFAAYNSGYWNLRNHTTVGAVYLGDTWQVSDRLNVDLGARVDQSWSVGRNERPVQPGSMADGVVVGQIVPAGYPSFVPTPEQSRAGLFGSGLYRTWDYRFGTWSASAGANYRLTDRLAVYGRASRGTRIPTSQQWTFQTSDGSQITGETNRGEVETTLQGELGLKASGERWSLLTTGFYGRSENLITTLHRGKADGSFVFLPISGDTRTVGVEAEAAVSPIRGLQLRAVGTLQDPRFTRFAYDFFVPGDGPLSGEQHRDYAGNYLNDVVRVLGDLTADYDWRAWSLNANVRYTGSRMANRPNTIEVPGYTELAGGIGRSFHRLRVEVRGLNLTNTRAIAQMASRTGEDVLRVNPDGTAESLVTTGAAAGTTTRSVYTTGLGILPRTVVASVRYSF